jgi:hypothetical protein
MFIRCFRIWGKHVPHPPRTRHNAYPVPVVISKQAVCNKSSTLRLPCTSVSSHFLLFAGETSVVMGPESVTPFFSNHVPFKQDVRRHLCFLDLCLSTFAISLQLFPASLIVLSLCSSAGVHGVFVRLFLALGSCAGASTSALLGAAGAAAAVVVAAAAAAGGGAPPGGFAALAICSCARLTDFRFLELPGVGGCGKLAKDES